MFQWFFFSIFLFMESMLIILVLIIFFVFFNLENWSNFICFNNIENQSMIYLTLMIFIMLEHCYKLEISYSLPLYFICWLSLIFFSCFSVLILFILIETMIIPVILLVFVEGGQPEKLKALFNFIMYTIYTSFPMMYAISELIMFPFFDFFSEISSFFVCFLLIFSFLSKLPIFLLHLWLPKLHAEAPTQGSIILAGLLLKLGGFGINMCLNFIYSFYFFLYFLPAFIGILFCVFIVFLQSDMKAFVAYSSVTHMNMGLIVILFFSALGKLSSYLLMVTHGIAASLMFFCVSLSYYFSNTRLFYYTKSMNFMFFILFFIILLVNFSVPPFCAVVQEFITVLTLFSNSLFMFIPLLLYMFLVGAYNLCLALFYVPFTGKSNSSDIMFLMFFSFFCINYVFLFFIFY